MKISFHGGAREVTGACYLLEAGQTKILIDCGLFQGSEECADLNFEKFKFRPKEVDALIVTHGHLDHVGRIPKLIREGFGGTIYSTAPTRDLTRVILEDAYSLAKRKDEELYSQEDLGRAFQLWQAVSYDEEFIVGGLKLKILPAGHILGSGFVKIQAEEKQILFTGDVGNVPSALLPPPASSRGAEYLIVESTYGNRAHEGEEDKVLKLERAVEDVTARKGVLMIPAFATERSQDILFLLNEMLHFRRIPEIPVFVDSPLATKVTEIFEKYPAYYKEEIQNLYLEHPNLFKFKKLQFTETTEESKKINDAPPPKAIIAGSGMMQGGRILHHLRRYLPDPNSILLVVGFQAAGSLGRRLIDGERVVKIFGDEIEVRAEIRKINGFSAHADNPELFTFVESAKDTLKRVFVVHGEEAQALHFMQEIKDRLGIQADAPTVYEEFEI